MKSNSNAKKDSRMQHWIYKYIAAAVLILIPLYPKFPLINISGVSVAVRLEDFLIVFVGLLVLYAIIKEQKKLITDDVIRVILLYLIVASVSLFSGIFITQTVEPKIGFLHLLRRVEYFVPLFLGMVVAQKMNFSYFFKILLVVILIVFIYGFGQRYLNWPIVITQNEEYARGVALRFVPGGHINSTFAGHYDLATFFVLVLPIVVTGFFVIKGKLSKIILAVTYFLGMWLIVNSASRISLLSYLISVLFSLILIKKSKMIIPVIFVSMLFILSSSNLLGRYSRLFKVVSDRFSTVNITKIVLAQESSIRRLNKLEATPAPTPVLEDRSTNIRLVMEWPRAIRAFLKNPLLGTGYSSITLATDNDYLRSLGETGILGLVSFLLIFFAAATKLMQSLPFYKYHTGENLALISGLFGSLPGLFINAFFIDIFEASKFAIIFWFLVGFCLKLSEKSNHAKNF